MKHRTRKDKRRPVTGAKSIDPDCKNNGKCPACLTNRTIKNIKREESAIYERATIKGAVHIP
jgi:hypothetical protein